MRPPFKEVIDQANGGASLVAPVVIKTNGLLIVLIMPKIRVIPQVCKYTLLFNMHRGGVALYASTGTKKMLEKETTCRTGGEINISYS